MSSMYSPDNYTPKWLWYEVTLKQRGKVVFGPAGGMEKNTTPPAGIFLGALDQSEALFQLGHAPSWSRDRAMAA